MNAGIGSNPRDGEDRVACAVCEQPVPKSVALMSNEEGYVLYFCGRSCQETWATDQMALRMQEAGEP
jgi:YHS domain-containing protein